MKITNSDFVRKIAKNSGFYIKDVEAVIESFEKVLTATMNEVTVDEPMEVQISKGVTLGCKIIEQPTYRHPQTQELVEGGTFVKPYARFAQTYRQALRAPVQNNEGEEET